MHIFFMSIIMGLALAMPVGPITIEMVRRTLRFGASQGIAIGCGATSADLIYFITMILGVIHLLQGPILIRLIGGIGAGILIFFAYQALTQHSQIQEQAIPAQSFWQSYCSGFFLALLSPFNILFWASLSAQLANITQGKTANTLTAIIGFFFGVAAWFISLNLILHYTRHRLTETTIIWLNRIGGIILLIFALYSLYHIY